MSAEDCVVVLTARGLERMLSEGGSGDWKLDARRAKRCRYVVCVQNRNDGDWGDATAEHHHAFVVGKLSGVSQSGDDRWQLEFNEYAEIDFEDAWPGNRNPVYYTTLEDFGIDESALKFKSYTPRETLTIPEAKIRLAATLGVKPENIEITVKA